MKSVKEIVINYIESDSPLPSFMKTPDFDIPEIGHILKSHLMKSSATYKLKSLKLIRSISEYNPLFLDYISRRIIKYVYPWALFKGEIEDSNKGTELFNSEDPEDQRASSEFLILLLDSIEFWSTISTEENNLKIAYSNLCAANVIILRIIPHKLEISSKFASINCDLQYIKSAVFQNLDHEVCYLILRNVKFFMCSLSALLKKSEELEGEFSKELQFVAMQCDKIFELLGRIVNKTYGKVDVADVEPKMLPRCDSPVDYETLGFDEELGTKDDHERDWQDIKNEFFRLKDAEMMYKSEIYKLKQESVMKIKHIEEMHFFINDMKDQFQVYKNKCKNEKQALKLQISALQQEKLEKDAIISTMVLNKKQMKDLFEEKDLENSRLKSRLDELKNEILQYQMNESFALSETERSLFRSGLQTMRCDEVDNLKSYSNLLTTGEGILFRNRCIEVGISLKVENNLGRALMYIGNCREKPIDFLETILESEGLKIDINCSVESDAILPFKQANRIILFEFSNYFETPPKLILKYNSSIKVLKLPITSALFVKPSTYSAVSQEWESLKDTSLVVYEGNSPSITIAKLLEKLKFFPNFSIEVENDKFVFCEGFVANIREHDDMIVVESRGVDKSLAASINDLIQTQISLM